MNPWNPAHLPVWYCFYHQRTDLSLCGRTRRKTRCHPEQRSHREHYWRPPQKPPDKSNTTITKCFTSRSLLLLQKAVIQINTCTLRLCVWWYKSVRSTWDREDLQTHSHTHYLHCLPELAAHTQTWQPWLFVFILFLQMKNKHFFLLGKEIMLCRAEIDHTVDYILGISVMTKFIWMCQAYSGFSRNIYTVICYKWFS